MVEPKKDLDKEIDGDPFLSQATVGGQPDSDDDALIIVEQPSDTMDSGTSSAVADSINDALDAVLDGTTAPMMDFGETMNAAMADQQFMAGPIILPGPTRQLPSSIIKQVQRPMRQNKKLTTDFRMDESSADIQSQVPRRTRRSASSATAGAGVSSAIKDFAAASLRLAEGGEAADSTVNNAESDDDQVVANPDEN